MKVTHWLTSWLLVTAFSCGDEVPLEVREAYQKLPEQIDFNFQVKPILSDRCYPCHGPDQNKRKVDLRFDVEEVAKGELKENPGKFAIVAGHTSKSQLVTRITSDNQDFMMPPPESNLRLSAVDKATLIKWIEEGAQWKPHWSLLTPVRPVPADVKKEDWPTNPIDRFVLARLEAKGLAPSPEADKATLLRRVTFDLTGLPPSLQEIDFFLEDRSPQAYEKVVERLQASPAFGERWCWDWLDAARYADTNGFQNDPTRTMWPWRDWVINAINDNMPFDQFTVEQLAGDLLPDAKTDQILATAFNRNHMYNGEGGRIPEETRVENVFDRVETLGTVWLGLTLTCARCHDHKFDEIAQKEYYQFFDYFNQTSEIGYGRTGQIRPLLNLSDSVGKVKIVALEQFVLSKAEKVEAHESEIFPHQEGETPADSPAAEGLLGDNLFGLTITPGEREEHLIDLLQRAYEEKDPVYVELLQSLREASKIRDAEAIKYPRVMVMDQLDRSRPTFVLTRGTYNKPLEQVYMGVPESLPPLPMTAPKNRLGLAQWLVSAEHPLTARVTVNRFWQAFFGTGIVKTVEDFGVQGKRPSHPKLMDWLAVELVESGWDLKALIKLIVMSSTYRQSSKVTPELLDIDPANRLVSRGPRYRLPSWMIRDAALASSGLMVSSIGGAPVNSYQPPGIWAEATFGKKEYQQDHGDKLYRRTLYSFWRRIVGPTMLFDNSARQTCSVNASLTNTPLHALTTLNDVTYVEAARALAERIMVSSDDDPERIETAFKLVLSRDPHESEKSLMLGRLQVLLKQYNEQPSEAKKLLLVGESLRNSQLDNAEHAAFTGICSLILNLDEAISKQ